MNFKAFGTSNPGPDAKLIGSGSSSLEFMKKAVRWVIIDGNILFHHRAKLRH